MCALRSLPSPQTKSPAPAAGVEVTGLTISLPGPRGQVAIVRDLSLSCAPGEVLAIVGESGSGKSLTSLAISGLLPEGAHVTGSVRLGGRELTTLSERQWRDLRGREVAMIFQNPRGSLHPMLPVGRQLIEVLRLHRRTRRVEARAEAVKLLTRLGLPDPQNLMLRVPHQLSGGMCQRIALAMALAGRPRLLLADEPTTALDAAVQVEVLRLLAETVAEERIPMILVTHDLAVVEAVADRLLVLYAGEMREYGPVASVLQRPRHPYTVALTASGPSAVHPRGRLPQIDGTPPAPWDRPPGCSFAPRCANASPICQTELAETGNAHRLRCHNPAEAAHV